jgi:hypothetical protein
MMIGITLCEVTPLPMSSTYKGGVTNSARIGRNPEENHLSPMGRALTVSPTHNHFDEDVAECYDESYAEMFDPQIVEPIVDFIAPEAAPHSNSVSAQVESPSHWRTEV